ncbi:MAG: repeat containing protein [Pedosphaera sp.]|nr:repeat containing protein [Pedosphaera sp.]
MSNTAEFWAGTDPNNPNSYLTIKNIRLPSWWTSSCYWQSVTGKSYTVKYSDDLATWSNLSVPIIGDGNILSDINPTSINGVQRRIYRVFLNY